MMDTSDPLSHMTALDDEHETARTDTPCAAETGGPECCMFAADGGPDATDIAAREAVARAIYEAHLEGAKWELASPFGRGEAEATAIAAIATLDKFRLDHRLEGGGDIGAREAALQAAMKRIADDMVTNEWDEENADAFLVRSAAALLDHHATESARLKAALGECLEALKMAKSHLVHQAAWITAQKAGYSFEGLGEDMPTIIAALAKHRSAGL